MPAKKKPSAPQKKSPPRAASGPSSALECEDGKDAGKYGSNGHAADQGLRTLEETRENLRAAPAVPFDIPFDILEQPFAGSPPPPSRIPIGVHLSTAGGVANAAERAWRIGANTMQIFSSSPRMWRPANLTAAEAARMRELRERYTLAPLVIHASYLVNCCSQSLEFRCKSVEAFRGEVERALLLGAEYLVLHPGSWRGLKREEGLIAAAETIEEALDGLPWQDAKFTILIENTAGAEFSLGSSFDQVAELIAKLRRHAPVAACLDTCHIHVAGYDIVSEEGFESTIQQIESTIGAAEVRVWHMNDAKAARGSKLDRHQQIGQGTIGLPTFARLLNDPRFAHCAFIAETPVDVPGDERRNLEALKALVD